MYIRPRAALLMAMLAVPACATDPVQPDPAAAPATMAGAHPHAGVDAFVAVQATWCDTQLPGDCESVEDIGLGYINAFYDGTAPVGTLDPAGANARWYAAHREPGWPDVPPFSVRGIVTEKLLDDGRRALRVSLKAENSFVAFYDLEFNVLLGADFFEYGTEPPAVAQIDFDYEAVLPAGSVGYPDLVSPEAWEGITRMDATVRTSGILRGDLRGIPAGTAVDMVWRIREFPRGDGRSGKPNFGYKLQLHEGTGLVSVTRK